MDKGLELLIVEASKPQIIEAIQLARDGTRKRVYDRVYMQFESDPKMKPFIAYFNDDQPFSIVLEQAAQFSQFLSYHNATQSLPADEDARAIYKSQSRVLEAAQKVIRTMFDASIKTAHAMIALAEQRGLSLEEIARNPEYSDIVTRQVYPTMESYIEFFEAKMKTVRESLVILMFNRESLSKFSLAEPTKPRQDEMAIRDQDKFGRLEKAMRQYVISEAARIYGRAV